VFIRLSLSPNRAVNFKSNSALAQLLSMGCTRLCEEIGFGNGNYKSGHRYCSKCEIFMITENTSCPCCNKRLRYTAHKKKDYFYNY
jgi:uncharacterized paraquat-inducible protein A